MVPAQRILDTARAEGADLIGLSGLITPSLEEMTHVAQEMQRQGFECPLMIGGATTSRAHCALKIEPHYKSPTVWVKDASRAVGVAQSLISKELREPFVAQVRREYAEIRVRHRDRGGGKRLVPLDQARAQRFDGGWPDYAPPVPKHPGVTVFEDWPIAELLPYIDWTPFFQTWELAGRYPELLDDPVVGTEARKLKRDADAMLERIGRERWLTARAVAGFWPARGVGDDVELETHEGTVRLHFLRQQADKPAERARFLPRRLHSAEGRGRRRLDRRVRGHRRARHRTARRPLRSRARRLQRDPAQGARRPPGRSAGGSPAREGAPGALGLRRRRAARQRRARRRALPRHPPGPGLPGLPRPHRKGHAVQPARRPRQSGVALTESFAMYPAAAVSGYYFSHPAAQYFVVGVSARTRSRTTRGASA
jgi:5-methyltetrahydrofolate--homocysteine methyltransferase